jgi:peptidoglycan/LPS O-acetylase OafA/YrhL
MSPEKMRDFSKRIPELDGIRGAAIFIVLIYHWIGLLAAPVLPERVERFLSLGWTGVDLFFVLSGFLIGGILIDERDSTNYFKVFYIRRAFRILPLYGALCLWSLAIYYAPLSTHAWLFGGNIPWYAYLTFGQNIWATKAHALADRQLVVTWSLAVEEQFYLTLPLVIRIVSRKALPYALAAGVVLAPLIRIALWFGASPERRSLITYMSTPCRMDSLLLGVLAACAVRNATCWNWLVAHRAIGGIVTAVLGAGILEIIHKNLNLSSFIFTALGYTWIAMFYLALLLLAVTREGLVSRLFRTRMLTEFGLVAYGLYLFHVPVTGLVYALVGRAVPELTGIATLGLMSVAGLSLFALVRLSWVYFEKPLVKLGHRYHYVERNVQDSSAS